MLSLERRAAACARFFCTLVVGADGINSTARECLVGHQDKPTLTGDLAHRLLLKARDMMHPELRKFMIDPQVNYWMGLDVHTGISLFLKRGVLMS